MQRILFFFEKKKRRSHTYFVRKTVLFVYVLPFYFLIACTNFCDGRNPTTKTCSIYGAKIEVSPTLD